MTIFTHSHGSMLLFFSGPGTSHLEPRSEGAHGLEQRELLDREGTTKSAGRLGQYGDNFCVYVYKELWFESPLNYSRVKKN